MAQQKIREYRPKLLRAAQGLIGVEGGCGGGFGKIALVNRKKLR